MLVTYHIIYFNWSSLLLNLKIMEQGTSISTLTVIVDNAVFFCTSCYRHTDLEV